MNKQQTINDTNCEGCKYNIGSCINPNGNKTYDCYEIDEFYSELNFLDTILNI